MNSNKKKFRHKEAKLVMSCKLFKNAKNIVTGFWNKKADILFIGEAPEKKENEQAKPFCGASGKPR